MKERIILSEKDEYCPVSHIGMYSLLRNPKNKGVFISEKRCQEIRNKTFNNIMTIYKKYNEFRFSELFNRHIEALTDCGANYFAVLPKIKPIAELINCSQSNRIKNHKECTIISFGIYKRSLSRYLENGRIYKKNFPEQAKDELLSYNYKEIEITKNHSVKIAKNALYRQFADWCKLADTDEQNGILLAIATLINQYTIEKLKNITEYDVITEFDKPLFINRSNPRKQERLVLLNGDIAGLSERIIERMNRDVRNSGKKELTFNTYVNNALNLLNHNVDMRYRDPEMLKEIEELQKIKEHNNL